MNTWVGKRLGKVQIESLVGRGGVAEVYLGTHTTLERKVAVKIVRNLNGENSDALARFEREARVIAKFRHPNIVQVHDFDTIDSDPYLVMEYIEGPSLSQYLRALHQNDQRLPKPQMIRLINAVAGALQYAHRNGVIHRDIKPGNILLTSASGPIQAGEPLPEDFEPVLTDFGLVRFLDASRETVTGQVAGTPAYMSPEQARGEAVDVRTDVYSLGIVLYEMLAGHVPFDGETTVSILLKQINQPPPPIPELSPLIENVLNRALDKDASQRFQTPIEFAEAFRKSVEMSLDPSTVRLNSLEPDAPTLQPAPPIEKPVPPTPAERPRWMRIAVLATVAVALGAFMMVNGLPSSPGADPTVTLPVTTSTLAAATDTAVPSTGTSIPFAASPSGPAGILRFQNGMAIADEVSLIVHSMPAPPPGSQYEVWLTGDDDRISLGVFSPEASSKGELNFAEPEGLSLLADFDRVEITIEPKSDTDPVDSGLIAYSFTLPAESLLHIRYLLLSFPGTPMKNGLVQGLHTDIVQIDERVKEMDSAFESDDAVGTLANAEDALNLLVGAKSADFKDWNGDGQLRDRTSSYGLLVNGNNFGYIQAVYAEVDHIVATPGSTQYMLQYGEIVKTCTQNLALWAPQLRDRLVTILTSTSNSEISEAIRDSVTVADQMLNGVDLDENGTVDTVPGECGAKGTYEYAYYMADMPILPVSIAYQLTVVANPNYVIPTRVGDDSQAGGVVPNERATRTPRPDNPNKPPKKTDKPPRELNNPPGQDRR